MPEKPRGELPPQAESKESVEQKRKVNGRGVFLHVAGTDLSILKKIKLDILKQGIDPNPSLLEIIETARRNVPLEVIRDIAESMQGASYLTRRWGESLRLWLEAPDITDERPYPGWQETKAVAEAPPLRPKREELRSKEEAEMDTEFNNAVLQTLEDLGAILEKEVGGYDEQTQLYRVDTSIPKDQRKPRVQRLFGGEGAM